MKIKPRKHSERPGTLNLNIGGESEKVVYDDRTKEQIEKRVFELEEENKRLTTKLQEIDSEKKNISSERLQQVHFASPNELKQLQDKMKICQSELSTNVEILGKFKAGMVVKRNDRILDKSGVLDRMNKINNALTDSTPPKLSDMDRERLYKRKRDLETKLKPMRVPMSKQWETKDGYEFSNTINKIVDYQLNNTKFEVELKNINRLLEPENPLSGNLGYLDKQ